VVAEKRNKKYGMSYDTARERNVLPVPLDQYGNPGPGGTYQHWDDFALSGPAGWHSATISLMYQPTSWEYIQFLDLANDGSDAFLAAEGTNMLEAWIETGMAEPYAMAVIELPEPAGIAMLAAGSGLLAWLARCRRSAERRA